jgi:pyridoxamine 5'-phosphate oxidase family protein
MFSEQELAYLQAQPLARIAIVDNDGQPTVVVVGFQFDGARFYISGHQLSASRRRRSGPRGGGREAPAPSQGAIDGAGEGAPSTH